MPRYPNPLFEQLFIVPETTYGTLAEPETTDAIAHTRASFTPAQDRAGREDCHGTRGVRNRVSRRKSLAFEIDAYAAPSGTAGAAPDCHDLLLAHGLASTATSAATVLATPAPSTASCKISDAGAVPAGCVAGFTIGGEHFARLVKSNTSGTIAWDLPLPAAPRAGDTVFRSVTYSPAHKPDSSVSIWRFLDGMAFAYPGCVGSGWELHFSSGNEVRLRFKGKGAGEIHGGPGVLVSAAGAGDTTISVGDAGRIGAGMILMIGAEKMKVLESDPESRTLLVERAYGGSAAASHAANSAIIVPQPEAVTAGEPVAGIIGRVWIQGWEAQITEAALTCKEGLRLRETYGSESPVGFSHPERRSFQLSLTGFFTDETVSFLGMAKAFTPVTVDLQAGNAAGRTVFLHVPRLEAELPEIPAEPGQDVALKISGICLEDAGDDEVFLAFA